MAFRSAVLLFLGCLLRAQAPVPTPDVGAAWAVEWSAKRLDRVMTMYTPDAIFFATDGSRFAGAGVLREFFQKTLATNDPTIHMHRQAFNQSGTLGYESGGYEETIVTAGRSTNYKGDYILLLRKEKGRWLIAEQMFTGSPVR
jgi:ketosteroid isomerase-like protein